MFRKFYNKWSIFLTGLIFFSLVKIAPAQELNLNPKIYINPSSREYLIRKVVISPLSYAPASSLKNNIDFEGILYKELQYTNKYTLISHIEADRHMTKEGIKAGEVLAYPAAVRVARAFEADGIISGAVNFVRDKEISFCIRLIAAKDGEIIWSMCGRGNPSWGLKKIIYAAVAGLSDKWLASGDTLAAGIIMPKLKIAGNVDRIKLNWEASPCEGLSSYTLLRGQNKDDAFKEIETFDGDDREFAYTDKNILPGKTYYYSFKIETDRGFISEISTPTAGRTKGLPSAPQIVSAIGDYNKINLSWLPNPADEEVVEYVIYRKIWLGSKKIGSTPELYFTDTDVESGKTYEYQIIAVDKGGLESSRSKSIYATAR